MYKLDSFPKPVATWCPHCVVGSAAGCGIYASRPPECVAFRCGWVIGMAGNLLTEAHRPDRSGVIITASCLAHGGWRYLRYNLQEVRSGAADTRVWRHFAVQLAEHTEAAVAVFPPGGLGAPRGVYLPESHRRLAANRPGIDPAEAARVVHALQRVRFAALGSDFDTILAAAPLVS